ncbi:hypothetical protein FRC12_014461 [Ceratobasidium sp. 428]|nr:hypothetical protein FRC12_014461 [Ceratobasidium sp. 428]
MPVQLLGYTQPTRDPFYFPGSYDIFTPTSYPAEIFIEDESKPKRHGPQQGYFELEEAAENCKSNDLLDRLGPNQIRGG